MIRVVIIEDEPLGRDLLRSYLALHEDLELVGEAADGLSGLTLIQQTAPDLILLDIQMPGLSGIALARQLRSNAVIVFITAHDAYAVTAFELGAFDYLLKPVLPARFAAAISRIRERLPAADAPQTLLERLDSALEPGNLQRFFVRHRGLVLPVDVEDIIRLEADDDYTAVHVNRRRLLVHLPLREMASRLDPRVFVRVHRSDLINLAHVSSARQQERRLILHMSDGSEVSTSRAGLQTLENLQTSRSPFTWLLTHNESRPK